MKNAIFLLCLLLSLAWGQNTLLVICHQSYQTEIQPYLTWKQASGFTVRVGYVPTIGSTPDAIRNYIIAQRQSYPAIGYIQLVGDNTQIPPMEICGAYGDILYGSLTSPLTCSPVPSLSAPVGRFSGNSSADISTQVERSIFYEQSVVENYWQHRGLVYGASDAGGYNFSTFADGVAGKLRNSSYFDRMEAILAENLRYNCGYYPGGISSFPIDTFMNKFNEGVSFYFENAHGDPGSFTFFTNANVGLLRNDNRLPLVISGGCQTGDYRDKTCVSETLLRSINPQTSKPIGAIAAFANTATITTPDVEPIITKITDIIASGEYNILGNIILNGGNRAGGYGNTAFKTYILFGDVALRLKPINSSPLASSLLLGDVAHIASYNYSFGCMRTDSYTYYATNDITVAPVSYFRSEGRSDYFLRNGNWVNEYYGANIAFKAPTAISILPGFHAMEGCTVSISIGQVPAPKKWTPPIEQDTTDQYQESPVSGISITNAPNPFNPSTTISVMVPWEAVTSPANRSVLSIHDASGKLVRSFPGFIAHPGHNQITWDGKNAYGKSVTSGLYFARLRWDGHTNEKRLMLLK